MTMERNGHETAVLDCREAAAYLAVSREAMYRLVRAGGIAHTRVGEAIRFRLADLDAYLEARTSRTWTRSRRGRPAKPARSAATLPKARKHPAGA